MQRLDELDASFASLDTPTSPMQVAMACTFDPSTAPDGYSIDHVRRAVSDRLHLVPPFRRRLVDVPAQLHRPVWIEDPAFELEDHVRALETAGPENESDLERLSAEVISKPLDRRHPLWEMRVAEHFREDEVAIITKVHHAAIDGVSGAEATALLLDLEADPAPVDPPDRPWVPDSEPSLRSLVTDAAAELARLPAQTAQNLARSAAAGLRLLSRNRAAEEEPRPAPFTAPRTSFNTPLTPRRRVAYASVPLADVNRVRRERGATVNDVILALAGTALRRYLNRRGERPTESLVAAVPVSIRAEDERGTMGNRVSGMLVSLGTDVADPDQRLERVAASAAAGKEQTGALGSKAISSLAGLAPPALLSGLARVESRLGLSSRLPPLCNVIVSSFPGPPEPLYLAGAKMTAAYPLGPLAPGMGLNITVQSYLDTLWFGVVACPDVVPHPDEIADDLPIALEELIAA